MHTLEFTTVKLLPEFKHRYKFGAGLYNILHKGFMDVVVFMDLGCFNTMIPKRFAARSGYPLGIRRSYRIGGSTVDAEAFIIDKIMIGGVVLERVFAFATDLTAGFDGNILLGTNVMNNWDMMIHKKTNTFKFREDPPDDLPNKTYIYQNYFDENGDYVYVQDNIVSS